MASAVDDSTINIVVVIIIIIIIIIRQRRQIKTQTRNVKARMLLKTSSQIEQR